MKVLPIYQQLKIKLPVVLDVSLNYGVDGEVFSIKDQPDRVIKLCLLYNSYSTYFERIQNTIHHIINTQPSVCVRVYECNRLRSQDGEEGCYLYYYIMERLLPLTDDEYKVFHTLVSHEDNNVIKDYTNQQIENILQGLQKGLDFSTPHIKEFLINLKKSKIIHHDLHPRNIMKNKTGDFKLVDLDRLTIKQ